MQIPAEKIRYASGVRRPRRIYASGSLLDDSFDRDACGVGFVASTNAVASHVILQQALTALARLAHRGATAADGKSSDGVGVMTAIPRALLKRGPNLPPNHSPFLGVG